MPTINKSTPRSPASTRAAKQTAPAGKKATTKPSAASPSWKAAGTKAASTKPAATVKVPAAVRDAGELNAAWASVRLVEAKIATRNPGYDALVQSPDFQGNLSRDLQNFVQFGKSSLTPYEARQVGNGLGFRDVGGFGYGNTPTTWGAHTRGDRVEVVIDGEKRRGILADIRPPELRVLTVKNGQYHLDAVSTVKTLAAGVNDGRS